MDWKFLQPLATVIAAIIGAVIGGFVVFKLQNKKRNDDIDLKVLEHSLVKHFKEFEQKLVGENSYLAEKGKNIATKEDIKEITREVEAIRSEFTTSSEVLKWQLSKKANLHNLQAEKEFEVYSNLWVKATQLRLAFEELRPYFDLQPQGTDWAKLSKERFNQMVKSRNEFMIEVEMNRPFVTENLYFRLRNLDIQSLNEINDFESSLKENGTMSSEARLKGVENLERFNNSLEKACDLIRSRISDSEFFEDKNSINP